MTIYMYQSPSTFLKKVKKCSIQSDSGLYATLFIHTVISILRSLLDVLSETDDVIYAMLLLQSDEYAHVLHRILILLLQVYVYGHHLSRIVNEVHFPRDPLTYLEHLLTVLLIIHKLHGLKVIVLLSLQ